MPPVWSIRFRTRCRSAIPVTSRRVVCEDGTA
jgi:hypothetical protein